MSSGKRARKKEKNKEGRAMSEEQKKLCFINNRALKVDERFVWAGTPF